MVLTSDPSCLFSDPFANLKTDDLGLFRENRNEGDQQGRTEDNLKSEYSVAVKRENAEDKRRFLSAVLEYEPGY